jgi:hypothetical protein
MKPGCRHRLTGLGGRRPPLCLHGLIGESDLVAEFLDVAIGRRRRFGGAQLDSCVRACPVDENKCGVLGDSDFDDVGEAANLFTVDL